MTTPTTESTRSPRPGPDAGDGTGRPRIAVLTDAIYPWHTGGKEMRQHELLGRLAARGFDVDVYTMKWWPEPGDLVRDGVTYRAICRLVPLYRGPRRSIRQALVFSAATLRLLRAPFDVLEADMVPVLHLFPAKIVTAVRRRPLVVTWHEYWGRDYWVDYLGGLRGHLAAALEAVALRLPDVIIAASEGTRRRLLDAGGLAADSVVAVPNGVDVGALERAVAADSGPTADLVVVGRLITHKNVDVALRALRLLHDRGERLTLAVVGDGPERERLEQLAADLGIDAWVTFTGALPDHTDVFGALSRARVLLFPSVREGFGMVALEAMALGTPVVTSDHRDNLARDLVRPHVDGEVVPPDAASVADAVRTVVSAGPSMGGAARSRAAEYSWDALADRAADAYRTITASVDTTVRAARE